MTIQITPPPMALIKSINYGTITLTNTQYSNTATITAVNTSNSFVYCLGCEFDGTAASRDLVRLSLTNSTTVTATRGNSYLNAKVSYCVVEFYSGIIKSNQTGSITLGDAVGTNTATITAVNMSKSLLVWAGTSSADVIAREDGLPYLTFTNSTTVTATRATTEDTITVNFYVVEFY